MKRLSVLWMIGFFVLTSTDLIAQEYNELEPGTRIRVMAPAFSGKRFEGTIRSMHIDTLHIDAKIFSSAGDFRPQSQRLAIPLRDIEYLEIATGKSRHGLGAMIGIISGSAIGSAIGYSQPPSPIGRVHIFGYGALGGAIGFVSGILVGSLFERWQVVPISLPDMGMFKSPDYIGLQATFRF